eukprot:2651922-Rhodomonas_salina.2
MTLVASVSTEKDSVTEPSLLPTETAITLLLPTEWLTLHCIVVSDAHKLLSHAEDDRLAEV